MIVRQGERSTVVPQNGVQHISDGQRTQSKTAGYHRHNAKNAVSGVGH